MDIIPESMLSQYFPDSSDLLSQIILYQSKCLGSVKGGKDARSHRWSKEILYFAISLYITSPRTYRLLTSVLFLPSESLIKKYKNNLEKDPGINHDYIQWMWKEAERTESPKIGGFIFDEMSIQSGLQLQPHGEGLSMSGFVDFGETNSDTHTMFHQGKPLEVATSVLQFIFLSLNGFRFPFTYMFCEGVSTGELHTIIMDIFQTLASYEFKIIFLCMDGTAINRSSCNSITSCTSAVADNIVWQQSKLCCIMDFSHVMKKLHNSLYSSGTDDQHKRRVVHPLGFIDWDMFYNAFLWYSNNHTLRIHRKLTNEHFFNNSLKMRNHLAENTSSMIDIFRGFCPIKSTTDDRLLSLRSTATFFQDWSTFGNERNCKGQNNFFYKGMLQWSIILPPWIYILVPGKLPGISNST